MKTIRSILTDILKWQKRIKSEGVTWIVPRSMGVGRTATGDDYWQRNENDASGKTQRIN